MQKTYTNIANKSIRAPISASKWYDPFLNFAAIFDIFFGNISLGVRWLKDSLISWAQLC